MSCLWYDSWPLFLPLRVRNRVWFRACTCSWTASVFVVVFVLCTCLCWMQPSYSRSCSFLFTIVLDLNWCDCDTSNFISHGRFFPESIDQWRSFDVSSLEFRIYYVYWSDIGTFISVDIYIYIHMHIPMYTYAYVYIHTFIFGSVRYIMFIGRISVRSFPWTA